MSRSAARAGVAAFARPRFLAIARLGLLASLLLPAAAYAQQAGQGNGQEIQPGPGVFNPGGGNDAPVIAHPMPPINTIPPRPMPEYIANLPATVPSNSMVTYDPATGQITVVNVPVTPGLTGGQTGGALPAEIPVASEGFGPRGFGSMTAIVSRNIFPWSPNCKIVERFDNGAGGAAWFVCSGTMIDPTTCLLAGHCVYNKGGGIPDGFATDVYVLPGWDGNGAIVPPTATEYANFGFAHSRFLGVGTDWLNNANRDQDWGVVALDRAVGAITGTFGTAWGFSCATIQSRTYYNTSYPAENPCPTAGLHTGQTMYFWSGTVDSCPNNQLHLNTTPGCFTAVWGGMSGSGMYYPDGSGRFVHAVCSTSNRSTSGNYCRLDQGAFNYINNTFIPLSRTSTFDLQALNCIIAPGSIQAGAMTATQSFLMDNPTNGVANSTWTYRVYLSTNDFISTSDTLLSTQSIAFNFPAVYALRVNMAPVTIPVGTPPGNYYIGVIIDPASDGNSANNATQTWDAVPVTITPAAPANDLCAGATNVGEGSFSGYTSTANTEGTSSCGNGGTNSVSAKDVWYRYTASATGTVNINTCGSGYDTVLSVHSACTGIAGNELACNDDNAGSGGNGACGGGLSSGLNLSVTAGSAYIIRVAGYNAQTGAYILNIVPIPQANDTCAGAIVIAPGTYTGTTGFADTNGAASCGYSLTAPDVWYTITPAISGSARLDTCGSAYDTVLSVHTACPGTLDNQIGCNDDAAPYTPCYALFIRSSALDVQVQAGVTYYIRVAGFNGNSGAYTLHYNLDPIANDNCDSATPVTFGSYPFNTTGATTDGPTEANCTPIFCCGDAQVNQDIYFVIVAPCNRVIKVDTLGSSFDTKLAVYAYCPSGNNQAVACNDDFYPANLSYISFAGIAGTPYYIRVGGYNANQGAGVLNITTCLADFNCDGSVTVADIFAFLTAWFGGDSRADINGDASISVSDIFVFLTAWFAGC